MKNKELYEKYCDEQAIPVFFSPWLLNILDPNWNCAVYQTGSQVAGILPYTERKVLGLRKITQPSFVPYLGPQFVNTRSNGSKRLSAEKKILCALFDKLPKHLEYAQNWAPSAASYLPLSWRGFNSATNYTHLLDTKTVSIDTIYSNFSTYLKSQINKASKRDSIIINPNQSADIFYKLYKNIYLNKNQAIPYTKQTIGRLINQSLEYKCGTVIFTKNQNCYTGGIFLLHDHYRMYYMASGVSAGTLTPGAVSLCLWHAIKLAKSESLFFDFDGSSNETIDQYFCSFGGKRDQYLSVSNVTSIVRKIQLAMR